MDLRPLLANARWQCWDEVGPNKWKSETVERPVSTTASQIKLLDLDGRTAFRNAGRVEVDSVFTPTMLGAQTQRMDDATVYIHPEANV